MKKYKNCVGFGFDKRQCENLNDQVDQVNKIMVGNRPSNNDSQI